MEFMNLNLLKVISDENAKIRAIENSALVRICEEENSLDLSTVQTLCLSNEMFNATGSMNKEDKNKYVFMIFDKEVLYCIVDLDKNSLTVHNGYDNDETIIREYKFL